MEAWCITLGGSVVAPDGVDVDYVYDFYQIIARYVARGDMFIIVVGGGAPARIYQQAYRDIVSQMDIDVHAPDRQQAQDRLGIQATHLNAQLIHEVFSDIVCSHIVTDPESMDITMDAPVLIGAGWTTGCSTDLVAVKLAIRFDYPTILNLTNIPQIYTANPMTDSSAEPLDEITWERLQTMVGDEWYPGMHIPFDPIATKDASCAGLEVISTLGRDLDNLQAIFEHRDFVGTRIH